MRVSNTDIDQSGLIEWSEFVFSLQGQDAAKYGLLADMELMLNLCEEIKQDLKDAQRGLTSCGERLSQLQREVSTRTDTLVNQMRRYTGVKTDDLDVDEQLR